MEEKVATNKLEKRALSLVKFCLGENVEIIEQEKSLEGTPDLFVPSLNLIIFVYGDFWHPRSGGKGYSMRRAAINLLARGENQKAIFWANKAEQNIKRDRDNTKVLKQRGYRVVRLKEEKINRNWLKALAYVSSTISRALLVKPKCVNTKKNK